MNTKLEVVRFANEDVIAASGYVCDGKKHAYMTNVQCNGGDDGNHPVIRIFNPDGTIDGDYCVYGLGFASEDVGWYYYNEGMWCKCDTNHNFDITNITGVDCGYEA